MPIKDFSNNRPSGKRSDKKEDRLRVNNEIRAPQVRVIDDEGKMLGVFSSYDAVRLAEERGLDLIEVAPQAQPPTCRIMDFGKWKYENKKKAATAKKKQVVVNIKEIQLRPRTDEHDLMVKLKHARRFLLDGDKVKVNLRFMGREMAHQDLGAGIIQRVIENLVDIAIIESNPTKEGKQMFALFGPDPVKIKEYLKTHEKPTAPIEPLNEPDEDEVEEEMSQK